MNNLADSYDAAGRRDEALKLREDLRCTRPARNTSTHMNDLASSFYPAGSDTGSNRFPEEGLRIASEEHGCLPYAGHVANLVRPGRRLRSHPPPPGSTGGRNESGRDGGACCQGILHPAFNQRRPAGEGPQPCTASCGTRQKQRDLPWYQLCLGLAEYRNGQYAAAERTLTLAEQMAPQQHEIPGIARLFRAMSLFTAKTSRSRPGSSSARPKLKCRRSPRMRANRSLTESRFPTTC